MINPSKKRRSIDSDIFVEKEMVDSDKSVEEETTSSDKSVVKMTTSGRRRLDGQIDKDSPTMKVERTRAEHVGERRQDQRCCSSERTCAQRENSDCKLAHSSEHERK